MKVSKPNSLTKKRVLQTVNFLFCYCFAVGAQAVEKVVLKKTGGPFDSAENFMQMVIDFFQGPWAMMIAFVGVLMVAFGILFAKDAGGIIGVALRVVMAVGIVFAVGPILAYFA